MARDAPTAITHPERLDIRKLLIVGVACFVAAWSGIELTRAAGRVAAVWPGNAVLVAAMLFAPLRSWAAYLAVGLLGNLAANIASGDAVGPALLLCMTNALEVAFIVALMSKRAGPSPDFARTPVLVNFVFIAASASAMSATLATLILGDLSVWRTWFFADTLGLLLLAPMLAMLNARAEAETEVQHSWEWIALPAAGTAVTILAFSQHQAPLLFLIFPPLIAASFRLGMRGAAAVTFLALMVAFAFTLSGRGPIAENMVDLPTRVLFLQFYAVVALLTALPIAAVLTERTRLAASLAVSERRFRTLAEAAPAGIFRGDSSGAITYVNRAWSDLTGLSASEALGDGWLQSVAPDQRRHVAQTWQALLKEGSSEVREVRFLRRPNGQERWGAVTVAIELDDTGAVQGQVGIVLDITARKEMERELVATRDQAEAATRAKASFLANMSHEIRTPLNGILGFAELLADSQIPPEQARHASFIRDSGRELLRLLNDILDLSKIEADQLAVEQAPFSAADELRNCTKLLDAAIRAKGLAFDLSIEPAVEVKMLGDSLRFRQIALNLLSNAAKFTETGAVTVAAKVRKNALIVEFTDTGIGISNDQKKHIFDPFVQADASSTRQYGGTGLGLGISRQLSELMGGDILLVSRKGVGTTVTLRLPFKPAARAEQAPASFSMRPALNGSAARSPQILVVEDIEINRELVCAILNSAGYAVKTAGNGRQAVDMVESAADSDQQYDIVLMDVQMPVMDGLAATRAIRALQGPAAATPIVALTAHAYAAEVQACVDAGMDGHLSKPISAPALLGRIATALETGRSRKTASRLDATVDALRPMFEEQKREIRAALEKISAKLARCSGSESLFEEAAALAHQIAGFAGTFGDDQLGDRARAIEAELLRTPDAGADQRQARVRELTLALTSETASTGDGSMAALG